MTSKQEKILQKLGLFSLSQAKRIGITQQELSRFVKDEKILRMERGIYLHPKAQSSREIDFKVACRKFGSKSAIGGLSALFYYNLTDQVPQQTWLIVPPERRGNSKRYRLIRTKTPLKYGIIDENDFRIVSIERAIIEGFKLASKIGERTMIKAVRIAIQQKLTTLNKIGKTAKELRLDSYLTKYFETIIGAIE